LPSLCPTWFIADEIELLLLLKHSCLRPVSRGQFLLKLSRGEIAVCGELICDPPLFKNMSSEKRSGAASEIAFFPTI